MKPEEKVALEKRYNPDEYRVTWHVIYFRKEGENQETDIYEDPDAARADFIRMLQEERDHYVYGYLKEVAIRKVDDEFTVVTIDAFGNEEDSAAEEAEKINNSDQEKREEK